MPKEKSIKEKTIELIDAMKATSQTYGMGNDGNEYKLLHKYFSINILMINLDMKLKRLVKN